MSKRRSRLSTKTAADVLLEWLEAHHQNPEDLTEGDLAERVYAHDVYVLAEIPLSAIDLNEWSVDTDTVYEYLKRYERTKDYPPIIYDTINETMIDGMHRANALSRAGLTMIKAYVPAPSKTK